MANTRRPSMAKSPLNALAGEYLREKRTRLGMPQGEFAWRLSSLVGLPISESSLAYYELGRHAIPAAALLAAQAMKPPRRKA